MPNPPLYQLTPEAHLPGVLSLFHRALEQVAVAKKRHHVGISTSKLTGTIVMPTTRRRVSGNENENDSECCRFERRPIAWILV
jgi:hypothetical protein